MRDEQYARRIANDSRTMGEKVMDARYDLSDALASDNLPKTAKPKPRYTVRQLRLMEYREGQHAKGIAAKPPMPVSKRVKTPGPNCDPDAPSPDCPACRKELCRACLKPLKKRNPNCPSAHRLGLREPKRLPRHILINGGMT